MIPSVPLRLLACMANTLPGCTNSISTATNAFQRRSHSSSSQSKFVNPTSSSRRRPPAWLNVPRCNLTNPQYPPSRTTPRCPLPNEDPRHNRRCQSHRTPTPSSSIVVRHLPSSPPYGSRLNRSPWLRRRSSFSASSNANPATTTTTSIPSTTTQQLPSWIPASTSPYEWPAGHADGHTTARPRFISSSASTAESSAPPTTAATTSFAGYRCVDATGFGNATRSY